MPRSKQPPSRRVSPPARAALRIALIYGAAATAWILASDWLLEWPNLQPQALLGWQTLKGLAFVAVTSALLFVILRTQLKRARASEDDFEALLENLPGMAYRCENDRPWTLRYVSSGALALTGYEPSALLGNAEIAIGDLIHPDDRERVWGQVQQAVREDRRYQVEYRLRRKDGTEVWIWEQGRSVARSAGDAGQMLEGLLLDVTRRKRDEARAKDAAERLETLSDNLPRGAVYRLQRSNAGEYRFTYASRGIEQVLGVSREQVLADAANVFSLTEPPYDAALRAANEDSARDLSVFDMELPLRLPDGSRKWINVRSKPQAAADGTIDWDGVAVDVSKRKQAELTAVQTRTTLETALASMSDAVFISDANGNLIHVNQAFATFHRFAEVSDCARRLDDYPDILEVSLPDGTLATFSQWAVPRALRGESAVDQVYRLRRKDTGESWVGSYNLAPIRDAAGHIVGAVVTGRDITDRLAAEDRQAHLQRILARTEQLSKVGSWDWNIDLDQVTWSDQLYRLLDVDPSAGPLTYADKGRVFPAEDDARLDQAVAKTIRDGTPYELEIGTVRRDGSSRRLLARGYPERDADGRVVSLYGFMQDVTEQRRANAELRLAASVFAHSLNGIVIADPELRILDVNPRYTELSGFTEGEAIGQPLAMIAAQTDTTAFNQALHTAIGKQGSCEIESKASRKDAPAFNAMFSVSAVIDDKGAVESHIVVISDITALKEHEADLKHLAHHDPLTGLPNRRLLTDRLGQAIALADRTGTSLAVCYLDLDGFKPINDRYGHDVGDQYLVRIAEVLSENLRGHDSVARLGGDEFAIVLTQLQRPDACYASLERILDSIGQPVTLAGAEHRVTASIGVTLYPADRSDPDALLRHADQAMYEAKQSGKNLYHLYDAEQEQALLQRRRIHDELSQALEHDALVLHFQPQVDLINRQVVGAEALIRWQHPSKGLLAPAHFLPEIADSPLEPPLSDWVIENVLAQLAQWNRQGLQLRIGINVSAGQLMAPGFAVRLGKLLERHPGITAEQIEIEVLESTAFDDQEHAGRVLADCHALGVRFALDDFGTGYSSLASFRTLPLDVLKIDQSFVRDMIDDAGDISIVESAVRLSQAFKRSVIAEGVETRAHAALVNWLGCRYGQGYGIARPMPAAELPGWISRWSQQTDWEDSPPDTGRDEIQLMIAAQNHLYWAERVGRAVAAAHAPDPGEFSSDRCAFGSWYAGAGAKHLGQRDAYRALGQAHRQAHAIADALLQLAAAQRGEEAQARLGELHSARDAMLSALATLVHEIRPDARLGI